MHFERCKDNEGVYDFRLVGDFYRYILLRRHFAVKKSALADIKAAKGEVSGPHHREICQAGTGKFVLEIRDQNKTIIGNNCQFETVQSLQVRIQYIKPNFSEVPLSERQCTPIIGGVPVRDHL